VDYEKMWNELKEHIDTVKCRMYEEGFDEEYEEYVQFSEVVQEIENTSGKQLEKENDE